MRRLLVLAMAAIALGRPAPAWAHEEISPSTVTTGKAAFLTVSVANEESADITRVTLSAPEGLPLGEATRQPPGWTAERNAARIVWSGGRVAPQTFEQFGFEIEGAGQPGPLRFGVSLGLASGGTHDSNVLVTVVAGPETAPPSTAAGGAPVTTPAPSATVTTALATGTDAGTDADDGDGDGDDDSSGAALLVAGLAIVVALVALGVSIATRRRPTPRPGGTDGAGDQDW